MDIILSMVTLALEVKTQEARETSEGMDFI